MTKPAHLLLLPLLAALASFPLATAAAEEPPAPDTTQETKYALDGYCSVTLIHEFCWKRGYREFMEKRGAQTYLFADADAQEAFRKNPERYMPVLNGNDPVLAQDEEKIIAGKRRYGAFFRQHIYLFANEESLAKFSANPTDYLAIKIPTPGGDDEPPAPER